MHPELRLFVDRCGGLVSRAQASQVVPVWSVDGACRAGHLRPVLPGVYLDAALLPGPVRNKKGLLAHLDRDLARRVAAAYLAGRGAFSHTTALDVWGLRQQATGEAMHLSVPAGAGIRSRPHVVVHQRRNLVALNRRGVPVTRLEQTLVDAWPLLPAVDRAAPVIRAVNDRRTTPGRIADVLAGVPKLAGRAELRTLLDRLAAGCRSALEIWGHDHVFTGPGMPRFRRQAPIRLGGRTVYLDVYAERELLDIELDGAASHGDPRQREIDLRRDALLATVGILVVRFSHRRLRQDTDAVRREVLAILASRRAATG
ncbi:DUF559 domain-containing protein [Polymorphospora sp. NPDC050346]|uniref:DUF559 domain-containing protein n=1 Tax=Polymorphospora sp. NPDC050346 TaxID=3155780 RepID=UPI0033DA0257